MTTTEYVRIIPDESGVKITLEPSSDHKLLCGLAVHDAELGGHYLLTLTADQLADIYNTLTSPMQMSSDEVTDLIDRVHTMRMDDDK